jgi:hypothetical protein
MTQERRPRSKGAEVHGGIQYASPDGLPAVSLGGEEGGDVRGSHASAAPRGVTVGDGQEDTHAGRGDVHPGPVVGERDHEPRISARRKFGDKGGVISLARVAVTPVTAVC